MDGARIMAAASGALLGAFLSMAPASAQLQCHVGTISFYEDGGIRACRIEADHRFYTGQGEPIICAANTMVTQHPGGAIKSCAIRVPQGFGGTACPAPGTVELETDGRLRRCG